MGNDQKVKLLLVCRSFHHGNTLKLAAAFGRVTEVKIIEPKDFSPEILQNFSLVGFGSGVYFGRLSRDLLEAIERAKRPETEFPAFLFYTSGLGMIPLVNPCIQTAVRLLKENGFSLKGVFGCRGRDTYPRLVRPFGGLFPGRPSANDLVRAGNWLEKLIKKIDFDY